MNKFDKQEYMVKKCLDSIEEKKSALNMSSCFDEVQNARMYCYGYIECLRDYGGLRDENVQSLQRHVLDVFKSGQERA